MILYDVLVPLSVAGGLSGPVQGDCLRGDAIFDDGRMTALRPAPPTNTPRLLLPSLTEAHCHLDKCHTQHRLGAVGGDLQSALTAMRDDKPNWTAQDLRHRARRGLAEAVSSGCTSVRSHIDWGDVPHAPLAWNIIHEIGQEVDDLDLQLSALTSIPEMADPGFCSGVASAVARTGGAIGAFVHNHPQISEGLRQMIRAARTHGLSLDFHVDETLEPANGVELIADAVLETRFEGPVLLGHACALMNISGDPLKRVLDKLARARIFVCALPTSNLYLQGRADGSPDRRGVTRLRELDAAGVPIVVASDNVGDAFCPLGQHDPRSALHLACLTAHLDPPLGRWLPAITTHARAALGKDPATVHNSHASQLRLCAVSSTADLIAGRAPLTRLDHLS